MSIPQGFYQINVLVICVFVSLFNKDLFWMHAPERVARISLDNRSLPADVR